VIEHLSPRGSGSPLHVHRREDEWFYVIEGELTLWVGGHVINAPAGSFVYGPRDIPHTYTVSSDTARFLVVTEPAGFDDFVRTLAQPAAERVIPPPGDRAARCRGDDATGRRTRHRDPRPSRNPRVTSRTRISEDPDRDSQRSSWTVSPEPVAASDDTREPMDRPG